jgi:hypothetical protein
LGSSQILTKRIEKLEKWRVLLKENWRRYFNQILEGLIGLGHFHIECFKIPEHCSHWVWNTKKSIYMTIAWLLVANSFPKFTTWVFLNSLSLTITSKSSLSRTFWIVLDQPGILIINNLIVLGWLYGFKMACEFIRIGQYFFGEIFHFQLNDFSVMRFPW